MCSLGTLVALQGLCKVKEVTDLNQSKTSCTIKKKKKTPEEAECCDEIWMNA